jgi:SP family galactose:H+ symporter-like MFS transporter
MGLGFELAVATVYIVEIASTDMRGVLGCFVQFMGSIGVLFTFVAGTFLNWYWLALVNGVTVVFFFLGMLYVPESPRWLILKGHEFSATQSLEWLRYHPYITQSLLGKEGEVKQVQKGPKRLKKGTKRSIKVHKGP